MMISRTLAAALGVAATLSLAPAAHADPVKVTVKVENLAASTSVAVSPLTFAFHSGTFDTFEAGLSPTAAIIPIAELGDGAIFTSAFMAGDPGAVLGVTPGGPQTPGGIDMTNPIWVDAAVNPYFSFGAMVVPSNDSFIGNDDPMAYRVFDMSGALLLPSITLTAGDIWDAGSEAFNIANAAFIAGSDATGRIEEGGLVTSGFSNFALFNGLTTAAGYTFDAGLESDTPIYRISFDVRAVPEPATWAMMILGFGIAGGTMRRRKSVAPQFA